MHTDTTDSPKLKPRPKERNSVRPVARLESILAITLVALPAFFLAACDGSNTPVATPTSMPMGAVTPTTSEMGAVVKSEGTLSPTANVTEPSRLPEVRPQGTQVVDAAAATPPPAPDLTLLTPTPVTASARGEPVTALKALPALRDQAVNWQADVRFALLANVRPGQQSKLLGVALGDPDVFEATSDGKGGNWTLVAVSPSRGAVAISADGTLVDLMGAGGVTGEMIGSFADPGLEGLELADLDLSRLADTNNVWSTVAPIASGEGTSIALISPQGLGQEIPTDGEQPMLAYQLFSVRPDVQVFAFFDALSGRLLTQNTTP